MFEHLNRLWKRIERIGSMNLCTTYLLLDPTPRPPRSLRSAAPKDRTRTYPRPRRRNPLLIQNRFFQS
jgi:hypothetical protein